MKLKSIIKKIFKPSKAKIIVAVITVAIAASAAFNSVYASQEGVNCDGNAVVYCGAQTVSELQSKYNASQSVKNIYNWSGFAISASDVASMSTEAYPGYVTKSGDVYLNNNNLLVATNALTAGRENIAGSTQRSSGGTVFYTRPPEVSFIPNQLSAFVVMKDGVFQFAILKSCGNPVHANPKLPNYTITKQVSAANSTNYQGSVVVESNHTVQYKITVKSTGQVPANNILIHDVLPANLNYIDGTLAESGRHASVADVNKFFHGGLVVPTLAPGDTRVYTFSAIAGTNDTPQTCKRQILDNEGVTSSSSVGVKTAHALVDKRCPVITPPAQSLVCSALTNTSGSVDNQGFATYTFTATAIPNNVTITSYVFKFGDGTNKTVTTGSQNSSTSHTYKSGQYNAMVTVYGTGKDGKQYVVTSTICAQHVTISKNPVCTAPDNSTWPVGSPQCNVVSGCKTNCTTPPTKLVNTGPGDVIAVFTAAVVSGYTSFRWYLKKKILS